MAVPLKSIGVGAVSESIQSTMGSIGANKNKILRAFYTQNINLQRIKCRGSCALYNGYLHIKYLHRYKSVI